MPDILFAHEIPNETAHNNRIADLQAEFKSEAAHIFLTEKGRRADEVAFVWLKNHRPYAIGFAPRDMEFNELNIESFSEIIHSSPTLEAIIEKHPALM
jgi:hypothetical protein